MLATLVLGGKKCQIDLSKPLDISIPLRHGEGNPTAWYQGPPTITPNQTDGYVGSVAQGGAVNFNDITFNPHAHGTHTECLGHITDKVFSVNQCLQRYFFKGLLVTVAPEKQGDDWVISKEQLRYVLGRKKPEALIIRTLPNTNDKLSQHYSHSNPPYILEEAMTYLVQQGIQHLLVDLPSVDKEKDGGALLAHKAFWQIHEAPRKQATLTELIFVPNTIADGTYVLNLQVAPFENDASPSRPVLYGFE
jgi:kynurenine formamidase